MTGGGSVFEDRGVEAGGGPRTWDSRSRFLRCSPAVFDIGSDRRGCDGWVDESAIYLINIKSLIGGCACGDVGIGAWLDFYTMKSGETLGGSGRFAKLAPVIRSSFDVASDRRDVTAVALGHLLPLRLAQASPRGAHR